MNTDIQSKATPKLRERAPIVAPKYLYPLIWMVVMVVMALLAVINFLPSK